MSNHEALIEANEAFYKAFESLDIEQMENLWLRDPKIVCIHPGWRRLTGWGPIMESWERIFDGVFEMKFELHDLHLIAGTDLGVVVTEENLTQVGYDGTMRTLVLATNIYERVGNKWLLVLHHGSPVVQPSADEPPMQ
jgi:ketosteroid isomerase-like protein